MLKADSCEKSFFSASTISSDIQAIKMRVIDTKVYSLLSI